MTDADWIKFNDLIHDGIEEGTITKEEGEEMKEFMEENTISPEELAQDVADAIDAVGTATGIPAPIKEGVEIAAAGAILSWLGIRSKNALKKNGNNKAA